MVGGAGAGGVCQISIFYKSLIQWNGPQRGQGVKNSQKSVHMVYGWLLNEI